MKHLLKELLVGIDHIGICVEDLDASSEIWSSFLGLPVSHSEGVLSQRTATAFLDLPGGNGTFELIGPMAGNDGLRKFLKKRGEGLHHVAFAVTDLDAALERLAAEGVELIDHAPRQGARGHEVAFIHPRAMNGVLVELVARRGHTEGK